MMNVDVMNVDAAKRRREGRLRVLLMHERQTVAMELAAALHHRRDAWSNVTYKATQGQKTGILSEPRLR